MIESKTYPKVVVEFYPYATNAKPPLVVKNARINHYDGDKMLHVYSDTEEYHLDIVTVMSLSCHTSLDNS